MWFAYSVYYLLPWLPWSRANGPAQAILFDIPGRRFFVFDKTIYPQDLFWLAGGLIAAAWALFFVTGLFGRVFCGYFCFQTLWTDVYQWVERLVQGDRGARIKLDQQPWHLRKAIKKGLTHTLWLGIAFVTGLTFTLYWDYAPDLVVEFVTGQAPFAAYATTAFLTATTYVMAGLAREQVCTFMCPYSRFQSVMLDTDSLVVTYDTRRGDGRTGRAPLHANHRTRAARQSLGQGDCIDCGYCVQVCPVGIDIRDGLQIQCIHCGLCIDACRQVMDKLHWPHGLIRYTSANALAGRRTRWWKWKNVGYASALTVTLAIVGWNLANPVQLTASVDHVRQPLFVRLADGRVQNSYEIKLNNNSQQTRVVGVRLVGLPQATLDTGHIDRIELGADRSLKLLARVTIPPPTEQHTNPLTFRFELVPTQPDTAEPLSLPTNFFLP